MKKRLAMKIAHTPFNELAPMWRRAMCEGKDKRIEEALKMSLRYNGE